MIELSPTFALGIPASNDSIFFSLHKENIILKDQRYLKLRKWKYRTHETLFAWQKWHCIFQLSVSFLATNLSEFLISICVNWTYIHASWYVGCNLNSFKMEKRNLKLWTPEIQKHLLLSFSSFISFPSPWNIVFFTLTCHVFDSYSSI